MASKRVELCLKRLSNFSDSSGAKEQNEAAFEKVKAIIKDAEMPTERKLAEIEKAIKIQRAVRKWHPLNDLVQLLIGEVYGNEKMIHVSFANVFAWSMPILPNDENLAASIAAYDEAMEVSMSMA